MTEDYFRILDDSWFTIVEVVSLISIWMLNSYLSSKIIDCSRSTESLESGLRRVSFAHSSLYLPEPIPLSSKVFICSIKGGDSLFYFSISYISVLFLWIFIYFYQMACYMDVFKFCSVLFKRRSLLSRLTVFVLSYTKSPRLCLYAPPLGWEFLSWIR